MQRSAALSLGALTGPYAIFYFLQFTTFPIVLVPLVNYALYSTRLMRQVLLSRVAVNKISIPARVPFVTGHTGADRPFTFCFVVLSYCDKDSFTSCPSRHFRTGQFVYMKLPISRYRISKVLLFMNLSVSDRL